MSCQRTAVRRGLRWRPKAVPPPSCRSQTPVLSKLLFLRINFKLSSLGGGVACLLHPSLYTAWDAG